VTIADQLPPPEIASVTRYHAVTTAGSASSGWRKIRSAESDASSTRSTRSRRPQWKPRKTDELLFGSQPHHDSSAPTTTAKATTERNAKTPAAIHRPARRKLQAIAASTASTSTDQPKKAASP